MDALKKAEKEKREAAERRAAAEKAEKAVGPGQGQPQTSETSAGDASITAGEGDTDKTAGELGLEPMEPGFGDETGAGAEDEEKTRELAEEDTLSLEDSDLPYDSKESPTEPEMQIAGEISYDQVSTLPSQRAVRSSLEGYFDATSSFDRTVSRTSRLRAELRPPGAPDQPTPVAAQTVFTAAGTSASGRYLKWGVFTGLVLVAMLAGSVIYYLMVTPISRDVPSPLVAKGIESQPAAPPVPDVELAQRAEIALPSPAPAPAEAEREGAVAAPRVQGSKPRVAVAAAGVQGSEPQLAEVPNETAPPEPRVAGALSALAAQKRAPQSVEAEDFALPGEFVVEPRQIKITRSTSPDRSASLVNDAYHDYATGNYAKARATYQEVLRSEPESRNALLGLAGIAVRMGELQSADSIYRKLLSLNPRDPVAQAGILSLRGGPDPVAIESRVKLLIAANPDAPYLKFDLGNAYARQSRWAEAQQAYFEAYSADNANADYALNLAVSLDHLGESKAALTYYNRALGLAGLNLVNFDSTAVKSRITSLSTAVAAE